MILQALTEYYERKATDPGAKMATIGFEWKEIPYIIMLKEDGTAVGLSSTFEGEGKTKRAKSFLVPQSVKKTSGIASNLLWDNPEYVLGVALKGKPERVKKQHIAFIERVNSLGDINDIGLNAVHSFLNIEDKESVLSSFDGWEELRESGANVTFGLAGEKNVILDRPSIQNAIEKSTLFVEGKENERCLISGDYKPISSLHTAIKGVRGAQSSGANIVSFNLSSFASFGKKQGANAPVGESATFAYTTALNYLLGKDSQQKMSVGDATTVFWAEKTTDLEKGFVDIFGEPPKDDPDRGVKAVKSLFKASETGALAKKENENRFYVLGLSPNASRISIRFWIVDTVAGMADKILQHFEDLRLVHSAKDREAIPLWLLLKSIASLGKTENIPPNLAGDTMRAILGAAPYPMTLLQAAVRRNRAEQQVPYIRAALIKACINRRTRFDNPTIKEELKVSLDTENTNIGYRLGRLFATLEKIQGEANPGINATIRDRFYGAASGRPVAVFSNLMRLKNHHLAKLDNPGRRIYFEKLIAEIMDTLMDFPAHLPLADQGRFAIGYYHQTQKFYTKKQITETNSVNKTEGKMNND